MKKINKKNRKPDFLIKTGNGVFAGEFKANTNAIRRIVKFNITRDKLSEWDDKGVLPSQKRGDGWRVYNGFDLLCIKIIADLRESGISIQKLKLQNWLKNNVKIRNLISWHNQGDLYFCTDFGNKFVILQREELFQKLFKFDNKPMLLLKINPIIKELEKKFDITFAEV